MKKILIAIFLSGIIFQTVGQTKKLDITPASLMKKSDTQYKVGLILSGTGTALIITALVLPDQYDDYYYESRNHTLISVLAWTGVAAIITSLPLFLSAGQNARTAAKLSIQNQSFYQPIPIPGHPKSFPSLSLKIPI
ncbi:hypothetical protein SYJ56_06290 [Algoriphagus sp. D3-2-R+10]|uniref:hypothetical protein n=1 Tax=Algoriphagus aurantiacus TaxID=3103948 RepID=UPI002B37EF34|nr:hypothetical protein [Algoriphagus sp. D3-2-R+10]MEB2774906.1 hypothetical protein [Algoriphagus sp. D3-2-R+10]